MIEIKFLPRFCPKITHRIDQRHGAGGI